MSSNNTLNKKNLSFFDQNIIDNTDDTTITKNKNNSSKIYVYNRNDSVDEINQTVYNDDLENNEMTNINGKYKDVLDIDNLLLDLGEFGTYQKRLLWFICLPACLPCGFCAFNQLFMSNTPSHWCKVPELQNLSVLIRKTFAIPLLEVSSQNNSYSQCLRYNISWKELSVMKYSNNSLELDRNISTIPCDNGWDYDVKEETASIVTEFNLVCDYQIYPTLGLVALNAGGPVGVYMFGNINDRFGRRLSFFLCLATLITGSTLTASASNFWSWAISRVIVGLTIPAIYQIPFIISLELVGPNFRSFITVMTCTFYTIGLCLLSLVTYYIQEWRLMAITTTIPFTTYFIYWWFLPESPRWLLTKGRFQEANDILVQLSKVNGKKLPLLFTQEIQNQMHQNKIYPKIEKSVPDIFLLFKTPNMRLKTCLITLNWFANNIVYVGLSYYGPALGNEEHLSFFFSSLAEIPSYLACWFVMDKWGRRWPLCFCMVTAGISCITTVCLPPDAVVLTLVLFLMSKSAISASFLIIYPFAGELYPTQLRGVAIGFSAYISGLGLVIIPFITYLGRDNLVLPLVIMGFIAMIGGVSGLRLPETLHQRLPQSVEEGEEFGAEWTWWNCCRFNTLTLKKKEFYQESKDELKFIQINSLQEKEELNHSNLRRLMRQSSTIDTQKNSDGSIQMTYWF